MGIGTDLVSVARVAALLERHGDRFRRRCFRSAELDGRGGRNAAAVAARWAAKEACLKALGTDVRHVPYRDVEVVTDPTGPVALALHGRARAALASAGGGRLWLSISHEKDAALAFVVRAG